MTLKELDSLSEKYQIPAISVDFLNHSYHSVQSKQLDNSRYLICTLTENGIPRTVKPDEIARLRLEKPDKTYVYNECERIEDGRILVTLTEQILAVEGKAQCDIQLTSKSGIIYSTKNFIINIDSVPYPLDAIESSNEFDALNDIIAREGERIKIVEELEQTVTENEAVRNENENNRIRSENIRNTNEAARQNQETTRQANENTRIANENTRISNENSRKANETVRQTNETNRQNNTAAAISNAEKATKKANDAADDLQNKLNQHHFVLTEDKDVAGGVPSLDTNRKVPVAELYEATTSSKGITQLTNSVTSTSTTTAATPNSVKTVNDAVNTEKNRAVAAENNLESKIHTAIAGIKSGDAYISVNQSENAVTIVHKDVARNNTNSTSKPAHGGTFTAVKSVSSDSKGHITGVDTETVTLPNAYTHPSATAYNSGLYKITTNNLGHVTSATAVTKADITGLGIPASNTDTHYTTYLITGAASSATANAAATNGNVWLNILDNTTIRNAHNIVGSGSVSVTSDANGKITINGTNTTYTTGTASTSGLTKLYTSTGTATDGTMTQAAIKTALDGKSTSNHTHNYAASSSAGGSANSAVKLDSSAGSATQPVYFNNGKPTACTYTLGASVPSGAKFTDTVYTLPTASSTLGGVKTTSTVTSSSGYTACPIISGVPYYKDTNTTYSSMTAATTTTAGKIGLVPAPAAGKQGYFLRGDATWAEQTLKCVIAKTGQTISITVSAVVCSYNSQYYFRTPYLVLMSACGSHGYGAPAVLWKFNGANGTSQTTVTAHNFSQIIASNYFTPSSYLSFISGSYSSGKLQVNLKSGTSSSSSTDMAIYYSADAGVTVTIS